MKTYLYIKVNNQWKEVDMFNDISIPITLKVTDIKQFGSKSSGYSLDFDIPHTANNAILFGLNADIDVYRGSFEVGKDYEAYLSDGCFTTFQGQFRLKKVVKQNSGKYIFYVGYLYGGTKTFVDRLGTQKLRGNDDARNDLNFSEYNTPASEMTLSDFVSRLQMHDTSGEDWALTLIDKTNKSSQTFPEGYSEWYMDECTPYLYAMGIFNRIISGAGYQYTSKFLMGNDGNPYLTSDDRWKNTIGKYDVYSLIYPYMQHNSNLHNVIQISSSVDQTQGSMSHTDAVYKNYTLPIDENMLNFNSSRLIFDSNYYSLTESIASSTLSSYRFVAPQDGSYKINISFPYKLAMDLAVYKHSPARVEPVPSNTTINNGAVQRQHDPTDERFNGSVSFLLQMNIKKNDTYIAYIVDEYENYEDSYTTENNNGKITLCSGNFSYNNTAIPLRAGDIISIETIISVPNRYKWYDDQTWNQWINYASLLTPNNEHAEPTKVYLEITNQTDNNIISISSDTGFYENTPFYPNTILNEKTTKLEYFNEFVKMFNLYVEDVSGKKNYETGGIYPEKCLRIEPYECFYAPEIAKNDTNIKDWTDRIDWDVVEYMRIEDYLYNIQKFVKVQNNDFYTSSYNNTYITPYMETSVSGPYCTSSNDINEIKLNSGAFICGVLNNYTDTIQCPKVFSLDKNNNIDTKKEYSDGFFFIWRNNTSANTDTHQNYFIILRSNTSPAGASIITDYYCADSLNKGYGLDDANLSWGRVNAWYQNLKGTKPSYNDLYSAFYKKQYEEYTDPDARIMKAKAYLTPFDIATVQMSDGIIIDGHLWRILEIKEWRDEKTPCEIELIKVLEGVYKQPVETPGVDINDPYIPIEDPEVIK